MEKKGQAAMEFLMTYGWAILAAIIAIGVLAYFGVFSPGKYMPNACSLNAPLGCDDYRVTSTGVDLVIRNGAGNTITVSNVSVSNCGSNVVSTPITDGVTSSFSIACTPTAGAKFKGDIIVNYTTATGTFAKTATGTITAQVA